MKLNLALLLTTLAGLTTSIISMVGQMSGHDLALGIAGAASAALAALLVDRDGDGVPPILDEDQR